MSEEYGKWISVKEKLPEPYVDVLIFAKKFGVESGHLEKNGHGGIVTRPLTAPGEIAEQWPAFCVAADKQDYHEVTHWMPLPSPPID